MNYDFFYNSSKAPELDRWLEELIPTIEQNADPSRHGDLPRWLCALHALPAVTTAQTCLESNHITSVATSLCAESLSAIEESLKQLHPWRKGPFQLHGVHIDSEWRCDKKWARLAPHIDLSNRTILDVGCGNGYYCLRMLGAGARTVIGIDPNLLFCTQFLAVNHFIKQSKTCVLPLGVEAIQARPFPFDTVFSMGILYHRRQPLQHLQTLAALLRADGELVLETLVIDGTERNELIPQERYANMRNVWSLPTIPLLIAQLESAGFSNIKCVDVTQTSTQEQRSTAWMQFHSLEQALDPANHNKTIEGLPAPLRAVLIATRR
ncbi:tRNA 5-methoxyuridine(34)/uridine 5-oxyacetic acid(34) synthase CmoB [Chromatiales bacterium (ex Bugula neritina AB1)]|nr:tRNA 5-methoxyuridine(34)/uridine 5-oxyacetic acid(34) synthase CmoB [Chromatiales bacterium (ex Bugula neritina AB1)]